MPRNFGYESNGKVCKCGRHHGMGHLSPGDRAAMYKRMLDTLPIYLSIEERAYLEDWQKYHGIVMYRMVVVGVNSGQFNKASKGQDIMGAQYIDPDEIRENSTSDLFKERVDING